MRVMSAQSGRVSIGVSASVLFMLLTLHGALRTGGPALKRVVSIEYPWFARIGQIEGIVETSVHTVNEIVDCLKSKGQL